MSGQTGGDGGGGCPPESALAAFADGAADAEASRHVAACAACRARLDEMEAFTRELRAAAGAGGAAGAAPGPDPFTPTDLVPGHTILEAVHRGGQGVVYRALQRATRRVVAIKLLLPGRDDDARHRVRFEQEITLAASLRHPGIVAVHDSVRAADGRLGFSMEYVRGVALDEWARGAGGGAPPAVAERLDLFIGVCDAVQHAHLRGIIHRDLKPGNILVDGEGRARLVDFGVARVLSRESPYTLTGEFVGTLAYASPEQAGGRSGEADARSDVYALGVILFELLTGAMPYPVEGPISDVVRSIRECAPRAPRAPGAGGAAGGRLPADLRTILAKALAKSPERRYQSAGDLRDDLQRFRRGHAIDARRDSAWYLVQRFARRRWRPLAAAGLVALAALVSAGAAGHAMLQARRADARALDEARRAQAQAAAASTAAELIRTTIIPPGIGFDFAAAGRRVNFSLQRLRVQLELGALAGDAAAEAAARALLSSVTLTERDAANTEASLRRTLATIRSAPAPDAAALGRALHELATVLRLRGRLGEATEAARAALAARLGPPREQAATVAETRGLLAGLLLETGDAAGAAGQCDAALALLAGAAAPPDLAPRLHTVRSGARRLLADAAGARADAGAALTLALAFSQDSGPVLADTLEALAACVEAGERGPDDDRLERALAVAPGASARAALSTAAAGLRTVGYSTPEVRQRLGALGAVLALKAEFLGEHTPALAATLAAAAADALHLGDHTIARDTLTRLAALHERAQGPGSLALVPVYEWLSLIGFDTADYPAAALATGRVVELWERLPEAAREPFWLANKRRWHAEALTLAGRTREARRQWSEALGLLEACGRADHYLADIALSGQGVIAAAEGRAAEGEALARRALERLDTRPGAPQDQRDWLTRNLARTVLDAGRPAEALDTLGGLVPRFTDQDGTIHWYGLVTLADAAEAAAALGLHDRAAGFTSQRERYLRDALGPIDTPPPAPP